MKNLKTLALAAALLFAVTGMAADAQAQIGWSGGIHYLKTLGDLKDAEGFDDSAIGFMGAVNFNGPLLRLQGAVEYIPNFGGLDKAMWEPQAYALVGSFIYGGVGIGIGRIDGNWQDSPFFALRAGVNLPLGGMGLDVFTSYRFQKDENLSALGSDDLNSLTFGALLNF